MTPEETSLARLLVALPGWRWVPGMLLVSAESIGRFTGDSRGGTARMENGHLVYDFGDSDAEPFGVAYPDLRDPATAGILLGMLHAVSRGVVSVTWYHLGAMTICGNPAWGVSCLADGQSERFNTEGEHLGFAVARALVAIGRAS